MQYEAGLNMPLRYHPHGPATSPIFSPDTPHHIKSRFPSAAARSNRALHEGNYLPETSPHNPFSKTFSDTEMWS